MHKKLKFWAIFFSVMFFSFLPCAGSQETDKEVTVSGESLITNGNIPEARNHAIHDALTQAVQAGIGVYINATTVVENAELIEDKILSESQGYITSYNVLTEETIDTRYRVTVKAVVAIDAIKDELTGLGLLKYEMDYPRLMVVVGTTSGEVNEAAKSARIELEKIFTSKHFDLIDQSSSERLHDQTKLLLDVTKDTVVAAKIGLDYHADVVLTGIVDSEHRPGTDATNDKAKCRLTVRAVDSGNAKVLASTEAAASSSGSSGAEALSRAGSRAGEKAARYINKEIIKWWEEMSKTGVTYRITLKNVTQYADATVFENTIKSISNVVGVSEKSFGGTFLECTVTYRGKDKAAFTRSIFSHIKNKKGFENFNLESSTGNNLIFSR